MVWFLIFSVLVALDQLTKAWVLRVLGPADSQTVIDGFFYLIHRVNSGGAWSLLAGQDWGLIVLTGVSVIASAVMLVLLIRWPNRWVRACLTVMLAGSVGNLIDRVLYGGVTDFLSFHFGSYVFPTFNVADICIVCGTIALCILLLVHPDWLEQRRRGAGSGIRNEDSD